MYIRCAIDLSGNLNRRIQIVAIRIPFTNREHRTVAYESEVSEAMALQMASQNMSTVFGLQLREWEDLIDIQNDVVIFSKEKNLRLPVTSYREVTPL